ncbi:sulfite exporter TauE/SafE family protein [Alcanivorax jadensis]|uniref:sulfite exporter TauE/SafE family protein n=1 Tax=Alcanivorax jadensis TaxID=64988 RepID=UPI0024097BEC|nr:sulfite exporter TauE/SafE family protein [Alcanivorax jadensis]MDF1635961.1 sulfite exporter TauE/SafE family protein [Alcanivorax jadensis]
MAEMITLPWLLLGLFIFLAFTTEAATGFGSIVIALSLGALVLPIAEILPVLVPLNIVMSSTLSWRHRRAIHWPTLWKLILPLMVVGTLAGYGLRPWLGDQLLKNAFGVLVLWFSGGDCGECGVARLPQPMAACGPACGCFWRVSPMVCLPPVARCWSMPSAACPWTSNASAPP